MPKALPPLEAHKPSLFTEVFDWLAPLVFIVLALGGVVQAATGH